MNDQDKNQTQKLTGGHWTVWYISVDVFTLDIETWKLILYVFIQIQSPVHQLTSILDFLVTIYNFLCLGGEVLCQIFMGLSC